ncbi:UvrD-helicase domain-containing protein [Xenorhabdus sp. 42]|uniref:UvrD-helicase domain-containing protein n=1 Tax=Xenorhabdus szentirmaii TaxID=290112 RepID=UPI0019CCADA6|nr:MULTISPECIES: UvrD-helicase domain-containing protein [unclassified Xenorhabdus]MBD2791588.1 UvrD-helicase domain-containing protein [Xenorhabdus sp. CUL]MBD2822782.1 UvrD-helicase domain-containing protein [Xenorhabdus sp. 42]MBD2826988.1 UvrD-helicase domain-containing protein [Xenorhabdus sp. 5]
MSNKLIIACAGAGKTHRIVSEAINSVKEGEKILIVTYTINNQKEIYEKYKLLGGNDYDKFKVKGFFSFLLEDIIRPYQNILFHKRIESLIFNEKDPHKNNGRTILGRKEKLNDGTVNPMYYLSKDGTKVHSTYIAKLSNLIINETKGLPIKRLEKIYGKVYFDEVQDLVGWDYEILKWLSKSSKISLTCVGDFRQTIYQTAITNKKPILTIDKIEFYKNRKFEIEEISESKRSILEICKLSDMVHFGMKFSSTASNVNINNDEISKHVGVFIVKESNVNDYLEKYNPVVLMPKITSDNKYNIESLRKITYGKSKGLGFDRVIIIPTSKYIDFLCGKNTIFDTQKTESSRNKLYVSLTRARYSVAIIFPDEIPDTCTLTVWNP